MTPPLNIVFVYADQLHAFALGCMGNADIETPYLDALAARGTLFQRCYTSNPVCTPYRVALFTGRYTSQTGIINNLEVPIPDGEVTLADSLNAGGYRTSYVGKWHIGGSGNVGVPPHLRAGFTDFIGYQCYNDFYRDLWFFDEDGRKDERRGHRTAVTTDIALERLARIKDNPFALCVSYQNPHYPVQPSREYAEQYWDRPITLRPNFREIERAFLAGGRAYPREQDPDFLRRGDDTVSYIKMYYAMVTELDAHIGRLVAQLDAWKLLERTLIVFTSDHGDMQGSHGLGNKHVPYEESTRVPLIVYDPLGTPGRVSDQLIDTVDFLPSLLDYAGCPPSPLQEGRSFLPITRGAPDDPDKPAFVEQYGYLMIVKGRHKLVVQRHTFVPTDLFDLVADPYEMRNLVTDPAHASVREALAVDIATWYAGIIHRQNPNRVPDYTAEQPKPWETKVPPVCGAGAQGATT